MIGQQKPSQSQGPTLMKYSPAFSSYTQMRLRQLSNGQDFGRYLLAFLNAYNAS